MIFEIIDYSLEEEYSAYWLRALSDDDVLFIYSTIWWSWYRRDDFYSDQRLTFDHLPPCTCLCLPACSEEERKENSIPIFYIHTYHGSFLSLYRALIPFLLASSWRFLVRGMIARHIPNRYMRMPVIPFANHMTSNDNVYDLPVRACRVAQHRDTP